MKYYYAGPKILSPDLNAKSTARLSYPLPKAPKHHAARFNALSKENTTYVQEQ